MSDFLKDWGQFILTGVFVLLWWLWNKYVRQNREIQDAADKSLGHSIDELRDKIHDIQNDLDNFKKAGVVDLSKLSTALMTHEETVLLKANSAIKDISKELAVLSKTVEHLTESSKNMLEMVTQQNALIAKNNEVMMAMMTDIKLKISA